MLYREKKLNFRTYENPEGIVLPVKAFGELYPRFIQNIQHIDYSDFVLVGEGFPQTKDYVEFQKQLRKWTPKVVTVIQHTPRWKSAWMSPEWLDVPQGEFDFTIEEGNEPPSIRNIGV